MAAARAEAPGDSIEVKRASPGGLGGGNCAAARLEGGAARRGALNESYLVDPASSHMLVSKIKPCMSKYKLIYCKTANGSLNQL